MAKRAAPDDVDDEVSTDELRRAVKRLHTGDEPRHVDASVDAAPSEWAQRLLAGACSPQRACGAGAAPSRPRQATVSESAGARQASAQLTPQRWKAREAFSQDTPESPTRPPLASEESEGPEPCAPPGEYGDINTLLRALHFERLMRLQARSPPPAAGRAGATHGTQAADAKPLLAGE